MECFNAARQQFTKSFCLYVHLKVGLSHSKKICVVWLIESPLKMMKNAFYFILKVFFILKIFKACVCYFYQVFIF